MHIGDWRNPADLAEASALRQVGPVFPNILKVLTLLVAGMAVAGSAAFAQTGGPTPSAPGSALYFVDVKDGAVVPPKFTIHFGLRGMGVAPAGSDRENAGHHHVLIDVPTPPLDQPIPNDFNHLHFGAGQTEAEIELTPGEHTLQLLLGDKNHVPHNPPLMSPRIKVRVAAPGAPAAGGPMQRHPSPPNSRVYLVYPTNRAVIPRNVVLKFGLVNMGVAPAGIEKAGTGHHHVLINTPLPPLDQPIPNDFNHLHFGAGQTEAQITLPLGTHTLQLLLGDENHVPHNPPVMSKPIKVTVTVTGRRPTPKKQQRRFNQFR
jgi:hypothetical protein